MKYILCASALALVCSLHSITAVSGVVTRVGLPSEWDGKVISCRNPSRIMGVVRQELSTIVFQVGPAGTRWRAELPAMIYEYDHFYIAPTGLAAVVAISHEFAYLVSSGGRATRVDGEILGVDYQGNSVLIATKRRNDDLAAANTSDPEVARGATVKIFDIHTGRLQSESAFSDTVPMILKPFFVRMSADGDVYYYIERTGSGGERLVFRSVKTGDRLSGRPLNMIDGPIDDALVYSRKHGYLLTNGRVLALRENALVAVEPNEAVGSISSLVESTDDSLQPAIGDKGWGVFDTATGDWTFTGKGTSLHSGVGELVVEDISADRRRVETYDISGPKPRLVRAISPGQALNDRTLACSNSFGFISYEDGRFIWHRSK